MVARQDSMGQAVTLCVSVNRGEQWPDRTAWVKL